MPYVLLIFTTLFWSGNFVLSRGMHAVMPPLALSFWRWAVALLLLLIVAHHHLRAQYPLLRTHGRFIVLQGLLGVLGFNTLLYLAMQQTTAINAVLVNSCIPVLIVLFSWLLYRETMSLRPCCGVLVSLLEPLLILVVGAGVGFIVGAMLLPANQEIVLESVRGTALEIAAEIEPQGAPMVELDVLRSPNGEEHTRIAFFGGRGFGRGSRGLSTGSPPGSMTMA